MGEDNNSNGKSRQGLTRRTFLETAGVATLAIGAGALANSSASAQTMKPYVGKEKPGTPLKPKRYNVLFILTDQERYLPELTGKGHWPGRDRLAKMGTTFENHQVCSMVCTSSRSVIFTGQHIQHTKMFDNTDFPWIDDLSYDISTIGHMMRDAGYYTTYQGKWHLHEHLHKHFHAGEPYQMVGNEIMDKYGFSDFTGIGDAVGDPLFGYYTDQYVTATSQAWLRRKGKDLNEAGQPWFKTLSLVNPHDVMFYDTDKHGENVQSAKRTMFEPTGTPDDTIYKKTWDVPLSPTRKQPMHAPGRPMAHADYQNSQAMLTGKIPNEDERWKRMQDYYFNCISDNDRSIDTILTELENLGMLDNTIVIMTADHGELVGAHGGMYGKGATAYREQNNVPFVIYHPDMSGGKKCMAVSAHNDIVPTILGMTGADKKQKKQVLAKLKGKDISPLLANPEKAAPDAAREGALYCFSMWAFMDADWLGKMAQKMASGEKMTLDTMPRPDMKKRSNIRTVFDGRYKYSRYFNSQDHNRPTSIEEIMKANDVELFDLDKDPDEVINLALDKKNQDLLLAMNDKLNRLIDNEVGNDNGSHLPNVKGVNWAFDHFDP